MDATRPWRFARLHASVSPGVVLDLRAMRAALDASGNPERAIPAVHVAGTNGKGSVVALVDAVLAASGVRAGAYTSPHLHRYVERFRVGGEPVTEETLGPLADALADALAHGQLPRLTLFEATTLLGWRLFREAEVSLAVLEVGLGGRLDATSVCAPRVTAITRIARDHEALLGGTLASIATEKAGILKPGVPCVLGPSLARGEAREAIEAVARAVGAPLVEAPRLELQGDRGVMVAPWRGGRVALRPSLAGRFQGDNLAVAVGLCEALAEGGWPISGESLARGVASARWPARLERVGDVLFDVAHNPDGVEALVEALPEALEGRAPGALVFGASGDKDWRAMLALLGPLVPPSRRYFAAVAHPRAASPELLASAGGGVACASVGEALASAREAATEGAVTLVCGSIFLVAEARASLLGLAQDPWLGQ